jgi:hypothetical protein
VISIVEKRLLHGECERFSTNVERIGAKLKLSKAGEGEGKGKNE